MRAKYSRERSPVVRDLEVFVRALALGDHPIVDRRNRCAFAGDLGRDALGDLARHAVVDEDVELRLAQQVDEAGGDNQAGGVDPLTRLRVLQVADGGDAVAADRDIGAKPRRARAIDDAAVGEDEVVAGGGSRRLVLR